MPVHVSEIYHCIYFNAEFERLHWRARYELRKELKTCSIWKQAAKTQFSSKGEAEEVLKTIPAKYRKWLEVTEGFDIGFTRRA